MLNKKDIIYCWVLNHICIGSNERTDSTARSALDIPRAKVGVPYNDFKHCISQYIFSTWQDDWNGAVANKLHSVKPVLGDWQSLCRRCRKDEIVLCRARIGHILLTNSYILKKDSPPQCEHCQFTTFWWNTIILLKKGKIYLIEGMWWNHLDSTRH